MAARILRCDSCETLGINGLACHETGCPDRWRGEVRECKWCGQDFIPDAVWQIACDEDCDRAYRGLD